MRQNNTDIEKLRRDFDRLKNQLSRMAKPHVVQSQTFDLIERNPNNIRVSDIRDNSIRLCYDEGDDKRYILVRMKGFLGTIQIVGV